MPTGSSCGNQTHNPSDCNASRRRSRFPTFVFLPQVAEVLQQFGVGLDAVDLPGLQAAATQPSQVAAPTVLLAQQQVDAAVAPLGRPPGEPAQVRGERDAWKQGNRCRPAWV